MAAPKSPTKPKRRGNYKPGPGRPPGRKNNKTLALEAAAQKAVEQLGEEAFEGDAHAFLAWVYKNPSLPIEVRIMAAGRALRVEKPTLSASRSNVDINIGLADRMEKARKRVAEMRGQEIEGEAEKPLAIEYTRNGDRPD